MNALLLFLCACALAPHVHAAVFPEPSLPVGVGVVPGTKCQLNLECEIANAVCWPTTGNTRGESRCACEYGMTWDAVHFRCEYPEKLGRNLTIINRAGGVAGNQAAIRYEEQWAETATPLAFPSVWTCDAVARYCWAEAGGVQFVSSIARDWWHIRHHVPGTTRVPLSHMIWRCAGNSTQNVFLSDSTAPTSEYGTGLRSASDHCSACSPDGHWCGAHGRCNGTWACVCSDGWSGERCATPPLLVSRQATVPVGSYDDAVACDPFSVQSTCGVGEMCYMTADTIATGSVSNRAPMGVCACSPGYARAPGSNGYVAVSSDAVSGGQTVQLPQYCINTTSVGTYVGAAVDTPGVGVADVLFLVDQPSNVWWTDATGTIHAARSIVPADVHDPTWRPSNIAWRAQRCKDTSSFFYPGNAEKVISEGVCRGAVHVCGLGVNVSASNSFSGVCVCKSNYRLNPETGMCDICAPTLAGYSCDQDISLCSVAHCSGAGFCLSGPRAYDLYAYDTARLSGVRLDPDDDGTTGTTSMPSVCVCNDLAVVSPAPPACSACSYLQRTPDNELILTNTSSPLLVEALRIPPNVCKCSSGYGGESCNYGPAVCRALKCGTASGFEITGDCVSSSIGAECKCVEVADGTDALYGRKCTFTTAECREARCSGHGTCVLQNQGCECDANWGGADCSVPQCSNNQPRDPVTGKCVCGSSFYGEFCQYWTCNHDSYVGSDGKCSCQGQWLRDSRGNCTLSACGIHGRPRVGLSNSCVCKSYASFTMDAPYCKPDCPPEAGRGADGNCTCPFARSGPVCEVEGSDFHPSFGGTWGFVWLLLFMFAMGQFLVLLPERGM